MLVLTPRQGHLCRSPKEACRVALRVATTTAMYQIQLAMTRIAFALASRTIRTMSSPSENVENYSDAMDDDGCCGHRGLRSSTLYHGPGAVQSRCTARPGVSLD
jgi:hypothetical protein